MRMFVVIGLETEVDWPTTETSVTFRGREVVLRPETEELAPTIVVPYDDSRESYDEAAALGTDFLSSLAWESGRYIRETIWTGGSVAINVGKGPLSAPTTSVFRADHVPEPDDERAQLALALYREAISVNSVAYQFLDFFKIINMLHSGGSDQKAWINSALSSIEDHRANKRIAELRAVESDIGAYLYTSGRCAVAHAFSQPVVNPDRPEDRRRLSADLPVVYRFMKQLLGNGVVEVWDATHDQLLGRCAPFMAVNLRPMDAYPVLDRHIDECEEAARRRDDANVK